MLCWNKGRPGWGAGILAVAGWRPGLWLCAWLVVFSASAAAQQALVPELYHTVPLAQDAIHDPTDEGLQLLQDPTRVLLHFPTDRLGEVDWVKTLDEGLIRPRSSVSGKGKQRVLDMDVLMKNTAQMPYVLFPHKAHTRWLACSNCHSTIFVPKAGGNPITMTKVMRGQYCGVCHGTVAFSWLICERCHSIPHGTIPAWWK